MKKVFIAILTTVVLTSPSLAQLGPAGVPGAPGLAPEPAPITKPSPESKSHQETPAIKKVPTACAKAKNTERCIERKELQEKAQAACKNKQGKKRQKCVDDYVNRRLK